jgi:drug/metabolite transporter (DMT)-like permease
MTLLKRKATTVPVPAMAPAAPVARHKDDPLGGILLVVLSGVLYATSDVVSKYLALTLPAIEIAWLRWIGFVIIVTPILVHSRGRVLRTRALPAHVLRALCATGSSVLFILGLYYLPLASATTINFVSPLIVTGLSIVLLREQVGIRRWAAVITGLIGVLIVVRPGSGTFDATALLPIGAAACWAMVIIITRRLAGVDGHWTAMSYMSLVGALVLSVMVVPVFVMPDWREIGLAAVMAAAAGAGQFLTLVGFSRAPASLLAPFSYVQLLWATAYGFLIFSNLPDLWMAVGAAVIIGSGMYTAHRERIRARDAAHAAKDAPDAAA